MPPENEPEISSVNCECGKWIEVSLRQAGSAVKCSCGRRVEVPLEEEFQGRTKLLSATTVESRIFRLVKAGELPVVGRCAHCGKNEVSEVMPAILECERAKVRSHYTRSDGQTLWIPFVVTVTTYKEEQRVEVQGHDTAVPAPMCVCKTCQAYLRCTCPL